MFKDKCRRIGVEKPQLMRGDDVLLEMQVDNLAKLADLGLEKQGIGEEGNPTLELAVLRQEGNRYFSSGQWGKAIELYSRCIDGIERFLEEKEDPVLAEHCTIAYSNRAEAWLQTKHHENALQDAMKALEFDLRHGKSIARKAKALCGLLRYQEAASCLRNWLIQDASLPCHTKSELKKMLALAEAGDKQSRFGTSGLNSYYLSGGEGAAPKCKEFVGPLEIRQCDNREAGRGLFATRNLKAGELFLVSNPVAVARCQLTVDQTPTELFTAVTEDLTSQLVEACKRCPRCLVQLYFLSDRKRGGASKFKVPPVSAFLAPQDACQVTGTASGDDCEAGRLDVDRIRRIVNVNAFRGRQSEGPEGGMDPNAHDAGPSGLWLLPSFLNHSCVPNSSWSFVRDAMFVRAVRDVQAGDEITIVYCNVWQPLQERSKLFSKHSGFKCCCPRCSFEKSLLQRFPALTRLAKEFVRLPPRRFDFSPEQISQLAAAGAKIAGELDGILQGLPAVDAERKDWIRASYLRAYMCLSSEFLVTALETMEWESFAGVLSSSFDTMLSILPSHEFLKQVAGAVHHLHAVPEMFTCRWEWLAERLCLCLYGPLDGVTTKALVEKYSKLSVPL